MMGKGWGPESWREGVPGGRTTRANVLSWEHGAHLRDRKMTRGLRVRDGDSGGGEGGSDLTRPLVLREEWACTPVTGKGPPNPSTVLNLG